MQGIIWVSKPTSG